MKLSELILEQRLDELKMSPSSLKRMASGVNAVAGMEFEMIVPITVDEGDAEMVEDWEMDETPSDMDDVIYFFDDDDGRNDARSLYNLREQMTEDWDEWRSRIAKSWFEDNEAQCMRDYYVNDEGLEGEELERAMARIKARVDGWEIDRDVALDEFVSNTAPDDYGGDMETWITSRFESMADVHNRYRIQWPHWTISDDAPDPIQEVAEDFGNAVGREVNWANSYGGAPRRPGMYAVEPDSSLHPDDRGEYGLEFISPPLPVGQLLDDLSKVQSWAGSYGCYTNSSCGLHINVSLPDADFDNLDYVKLALFLGDQYVLDQFGRAGNEYCNSALDRIDARIQNIKDVTPIMDNLKNGLALTASRAIHGVETNKYTSINIKGGYIEFRSPGGDWLDENFGLIQDTLYRFVVAMDIAMDQTKYTKEYAKRLYKMLAPQNGDDDVTQLFAQYSAGFITSGYLTRAVRQIQRARYMAREWAVTDADSSEVYSTHPTRRDAQAEMTSMLANDPTMRLRVAVPNFS